ncbi:MAG: hypothetical protein DRP12_00115 [Candidatus Aenigmatarchaeota archaeon]|nr:MAG: hypothetical protein DRP12_00115 [Candidatus Aenigmarchaeota archaeon]
MPARFLITGIRAVGQVEGQETEGRCDPGGPVTVYIDWLNAGDESGYLCARITDLDTGEVVWGISIDQVKLPAGHSGTLWNDPPFTMPERDWRLKVELGHLEDSQKVYDDSMEITIESTRKAVAFALPWWALAMLAAGTLISQGGFK